jgi:glycosyltransferase involved in cell wall biosynthesis
MPKILRILNRLNVGGPTYNVAYLSKYLDDSYETRVLAGHKDLHEGSSAYVLNDLGVAFDYVPGMFRQLNPANDLRAYRFIQDVVNQYKPDIVHTHAAKAGALGRMAAYYSKNRPKAIIHTYHGNVFDGYFSPLKTRIFLSVERYLCKLSTAIIAISEVQKRDMVEKYKLAPAEKIHVIRLGFDLQKFQDDRTVKRKQFRDFYQLNSNTVVVSIIGRLAPVKNHTLFIDVVKYLKTKDPSINIKFFIIGDGESRDGIISMIQNYGLSYCLPEDDNYEADIVFTSWRKDIDVVNAGSDIIALTSLNEGTPVSIIEAMASGKAVISTDVGGIRDIISDGNSGIISDVTVSAFAGNLYKLAVDKLLRDHLAANGEVFVLNNYSYRRLIKDIEQLYKNILA